MKKILSVLLALVMAFSMISFSAAESAEYTVQSTPVWRNNEQIGAMDLRFYPDMPHVPFLGMKTYVAFMLHVDLAVAPQEGGVWQVTHPNGTSILVNPAAGTITADDWALFQNPPVPYEGRAVGIKDSPCAWSRYTELVFDDPPKAVVFDFARYGIPLRADTDDVYLPLALLSTMFSDVAINYVIYNGEKIIVPVLDLNALTGLPAGYYESEQMRALLTGEAQREEDVIREGYAELCFVMDYFFGHPGVAALDQGIAEKGFDAALLDLPDGKGESIRAALHSPDMAEYLVGVNDLFNYGLDDGHTVFTGVTDLVSETTPYQGVRDKLMASILPIAAQLSSTRRYMLMSTIKQQRTAAWGDELYREYGSTAILRIDAFNYDTAGWEAYYAGKGEVPMDALGITWTGLNKASENPAIKNILFDFTANSGGSGDLLLAVISLLFGDNVFRGYNVLTGQHEHATAQVDRNLDGVLDEKDNEVSFDFNYGVLTTRVSFSCGNLFPFLMQEHGAVLLGEPTGGGSCSVQTATLTGGVVFMMSSYLWALRTREDVSVESGCRTDVPIPRVDIGDPDDRISLGDYSGYFSDEALDRMMNEWFAEELAPAA